MMQLGLIDTSSSTHSLSINSNACSHFHFHPDDDWTIQSNIDKLFSQLKLVTDNLSIYICVCIWNDGHTIS